MSAQVYRTHSEEETIAVGEALASRLPPGATVLLVGNLGSGKTTLAKGIVKGLGAAAPEDVSSPTFTLVHEHGEDRKVYHIDLYRIQNLHEAASIGLDELLEGDAVVLVEWGERFPELWPADRIEIRLEWVGETEREMRVVGDVGRLA
jgi:tRNA threonylcarbamoyladenosine biosynthesis protein TsaE